MDIVQLWEICLQFEYDKDKILEGLDRFLSKYKNKKILDCACGTGFLTLDLIKKGYNITCSDGSKDMLQEFRKNAKNMGVQTKPHLLKWSQLSKKFKGKFDVVLCRGSSLIYGSSWDSCRINSEKTINNALINFFDCLKPNGIIYVDTTAKENLIRTKPQVINYPFKQVNGFKVKLLDKVTTDKKHKVRIWEPTLQYGGKKYRLKRFSYYLPHKQLIQMMQDCGFVNIKKRKIKGEHYDVFVGQKGGIPKQ